MTDPRVIVRLDLSVPRYVWWAVAIACITVGAAAVITADAVAAHLTAAPASRSAP